MSYPLSKTFFIAAVCLFVGACSQKDSVQVDSAETPSPVVQEAVLKEVDTQPVTELDSVHLSEKLQETYQQTCGTCHERGVINAPKTGDGAAWAPRMAQGMDTLLNHVRDGFKAMPPAGLCYGCSDEDFEALIRYMAAPRSTSPDAG